MRPDTWSTPSEAIEGYVRWVHRTGLMPSTTESYERLVRAFGAWLESKAPAYASALTDEYERDYAVRDFRRDLLTTRSLAPRTVAQYMSAVGSFFTWLGLGRPTNAGVDVPASSRTGVQEADQMRAVLRAAQRRGARDFALVATAMLAGPRVSEIEALNLDDVAITDRKGQMQVRYGKGGKPRTIELGPQVREALRGWLAERPGWRGADSPALFLSRTGRRMPERTIQHAVARVGEAAGVDLSPHILRHTYGRRWIEQGGDIVSLQGQMGHASLATTALYAKPSAAYLEAQAGAMDVEL